MKDAAQKPSRGITRARALLAELDQVLAELQQVRAPKARKRPVVDADAKPEQKTVESVRRKLRRGGFAA